jgi:hypothetical protein
LVEIGLTVKSKPKQPPPERAARARELAGKAIEKSATHLFRQKSECAAAAGSRRDRWSFAKIV